jgi:hypothetical protein
MKIWKKFVVWYEKRPKWQRFLIYYGTCPFWMIPFCAILLIALIVLYPVKAIMEAWQEFK